MRLIQLDSVPHLSPPVSSNQPTHHGVKFLERAVIGLMVVSLFLGVVYAFAVPVGIPADEPAHFYNVLYYAIFERMPILGQPGVLYEGQMGPVYYLANALLLVNFLHHRLLGFYLLRLAGLPLIALVILLTYKIARSVAPDHAPIQLAMTSFMALNPSLLAIASSVQNDYLSIAMSLFATWLCLRWCPADAKRIELKALALGLIVGIAILTKASIVFLPAAIFVFWALYGKARFRFASIFSLTVVTSTAWWFYRNYVLYHDFSAQSFLTKCHYGNNPPPINLLNPYWLCNWLYTMQAYCWLPAEYYRGVIHAGPWLQLAIGSLVVAALSGILLSRRKLPGFFTELLGRRALHLLAIEYLFCLGIFTYTCTHITNFAWRVTFPTIIVYGTFIAIGGCALNQLLLPAKRMLFPACLICCLLAANIFVLNRVVIPVNHPPFIQFQ